jgi:hypothetical protein
MFQPNGPISVADAEEPIVAGMSGSPILAADGTVIGLVSESGGNGELGDHREGDGPTIMRNLPGWLPRELAAAKK